MIQLTTDFRRLTSVLWEALIWFIRFFGFVAFVAFVAFIEFIVLVELTACC